MNIGKTAMDKRRDGHMEEIDIRMYGHMGKWRLEISGRDDMER